MAVLIAACLLACAGCAQAKVDDDSPRVVDVELSSKGARTEASQEAAIKLSFDQPISVSGDPAGDFRVLLNGAELDSGTVALDVRASAEGITFALHPAPGASAGGGAGSFFALYQAGFSVASARDDGALPSVTGASGSCAVLDEPVTGTLPSGLSVEVLEQRAGSTADNVPAETVFRVTSPALIRAITWFSPDGGQTKLLKHNHAFADSDAADAAADLAKLVSGTAELGLSARASGDTVTLTAVTAVGGQVVDPMVVEGVGVEGGAYDPSQAREGEG